MKEAMFRNVVPATLAALVVFSTIPFVESLFRLHRQTVPAIEWHSVEVLTPKVRPGEILRINYVATINKQCPSDIRGFLVLPDNSVPVRFPVVSGGYTRPADGPTNIRVNIPIPLTADPGLAPFVSGPYLYRSLVTRFCPDGFEEDVSVPDAHFILER